jgi:hypothetical protein
MAGVVWGLTVPWIGGAGLATCLGRNAVREFLRRWANRRVVIFLVFATALALVEEGRSLSPTETRVPNDPF